MFRKEFIIVLLGVAVATAFLFFDTCKDGDSTNHFGIKRGLRGRTLYNVESCYL